MNIDAWLSKEYTRIVKLNDKEEKQRQLKLYNGLVDKKNEYNDYLLNYKKSLLEIDMRSRGIILEKSNVTSKLLRNKWENNFTIGLTKEDKKRIIFNYHMWHIYSYEVKDALAKSKARQAFNKKNKNHVYVLFDDNEDVFYIENAELLKSSDFDMEEDVYVVDSEMKWTYVHTHEFECGPYFANKI